MTRKPVVAGNWKMNLTVAEATALVKALKQETKANTSEMILFPSFIHLAQVKALITGTPIKLGAQNVSPGTFGAFTGEISGPMLKDLGCEYVLVGHSERRHLFQESLSIVAAKFMAVKEAGLKPILCVGETLAERESNKTNQIIFEQIQSILDMAGITSFAEEKAMIAYEPVWAIGTGKTASPQQAEAVHEMIRQLLAKQDLAVANQVRILYGGSVKADNAEGLFAEPNIDGGLVGGASLDPTQFLAIYKAANHCFV